MGRESRARRAYTALLPSFALLSPPLPLHTHAPFFLSSRHATYRQCICR